jgi:EAL domain-containing protein (putative c-di-GMP-specific phosphodiesterase class I)
MLEVTEGVLIDNPEETVKRLEALHNFGVRIGFPVRAARAGRGD